MHLRKIKRVPGVFNLDENEVSHGNFGQPLVNIEEISNVDGVDEAMVGATPVSSSESDDDGKGDKHRKDMSRDERDGSDDDVFGFNANEVGEDSVDPSSDSMPINPPLKVLKNDPLDHSKAPSTYFVKSQNLERKADKDKLNKIPQNELANSWQMVESHDHQPFETKNDDQVPSLKLDIKPKNPMATPIQLTKPDPAVQVKALELPIENSNRDLQTFASGRPSQSHHNIDSPHLTFYQNGNSVAVSPDPSLPPSPQFRSTHAQPTVTKKPETEINPFPTRPQQPEQKSPKQVDLKSSLNSEPKSPQHEDKPTPEKPRKVKISAGLKSKLMTEEQSNLQNSKRPPIIIRSNMNGYFNPSPDQHGDDTPGDAIKKSTNSNQSPAESDRNVSPQTQHLSPIGGRNSIKDGLANAMQPKPSQASFHGTIQTEGDSIAEGGIKALFAKRKADMNDQRASIQTKYEESIVLSPVPDDGAPKSVQISPPQNVAIGIPESASTEYLSPSKKPELRKSVFNLLGKDPSKLDLPVSPITDKNASKASLNAKFDIKELLPHQDALKDMKHTVLLTHFQKSSSNCVHDGHTLKISKNTNRNFQLHDIEAFYNLDGVNEQYKKMANESRAMDNGFFTPLTVEMYETEHKAVAFLEAPSKLGLTIQLVSDYQKRSLLKMRSCLEPIKCFARIYKLNKKELLTYSKLSQVKNLLSLMICYLYDHEYDPSEDYSKYEFSEEPKKQRQSVLKEMGLIDALMDIIHYPFLNNFYTIEEIHRPLYISNVISLSYTAIKVGIQELRPIELYASQWLEMMIDYSLKDKKNALNAKLTLTELIDNNEKILNSQIKISTMQKFINYLLVSGSDEQAVGILKATCICNGKPVPKNQELITEILIERKDTLRQIISELRFRDNGQIYINNPFSSITGAVTASAKTLDLKDLQEKSEFIDKGKYFNFYVSLIEFFADICNGRNYAAINILKEFFPLDAVSEIICSDSYCTELRTAFCKLLEHMYINVFPFQTIFIPYCIRYLSDLNEDILSAATKPNDQLAKFDKITQFIFKFLSLEASSNDLTYKADMAVSVISLCENMIKLGFFRDIHSFRMIYSGLMKMLSASSNKDKMNSRNDLARLSLIKVSMSSGNNIGSTSESSESEMMFNKIRIAVCNLMRLLCKVEIDFSVTKTLALYRSDGKQELDLKTISLENESLVADSGIASDKGNKELRKLFDLIEKEVIMSRDKLITKNDELVSALINNTLSSDVELKERSLELIKDLFSETKNLVNNLKHVVVVDSEVELSLKRECEDLHKVAFKLFEKISHWFNRETASEYLQVKDILMKLGGLLIDEYASFNAGGFGDNPKMSQPLSEMEFKYVFVRLLLGKNLKKVSNLFQSILGGTGMLTMLSQCLEHMINHSIEASSPEMLETNKILMNKLTVILCKAVFEHRANKEMMIPLVLTILEAIPKYSSQGVSLEKKAVKSKFSAKEFEKASVVDGASYYGSIRVLGDQHGAGEESSISKLGNSQNLSLMPSGDLPFFGNLITLVIHICMNNKELLKNPVATEKILRALATNLSNASKKKSNYFLMAQYMFAMEVLIFDEFRPIKTSQDTIIKLVVEKNKEGVLGRYTNSNIKAALKQSFKLPFSRQTISSSSVEVIPARLCADLAFIDILTFCSYGKNEYSEKIAQRFLSPE